MDETIVLIVEKLMGTETVMATEMVEMVMVVMEMVATVVEMAVATVAETVAVATVEEVEENEILLRLL